MKSFDREPFSTSPLQALQCIEDPQRKYSVPLEGILSISFSLYKTF